MNATGSRPRPLLLVPLILALVGHGPLTPIAATAHAHVAHGTAPVCQRSPQPTTPLITALTPSPARPGAPVYISGAGFLPRGRLELEFFPGTAPFHSYLAFVVADAGGALKAVPVTLPTTFPPGPAAVQAVGSPGVSDWFSFSVASPPPGSSAAPAGTPRAESSGTAPAATPVPAAGTPQPAVTPSPATQVRYAPLPSPPVWVKVDQPTGTVFVTSAGGLLSMLSGATGRPPAWSVPAGSGWPVGTIWPLAESAGQVYFTCGRGLYLLGPGGVPHPTRIRTLPTVSAAQPPVVDEPLQRLFTAVPLGDGTAPIQAFDTSTGRRLFITRSPAYYFGPLAVDSRGERLYAIGHPVQPGGLVGGPSDLYRLTLGGSIDGSVEGSLGIGSVASQLALAGPLRRLLVFGCSAGSGGSTPQEYAQVLNLATQHFLTLTALTLGACGGPQTGSLLNAGTPGILAVDAGAETAVVISANGAPMNPSAPPSPGFAWFLNLRTGRVLQTGTAYGCVQVGRQPSAVAIDSRLHRAYVASSADGLVTVLDTRTGHVLGVVHVGGTPTSIAVDTHDHQVAVALEGPAPSAPYMGGSVEYPGSLNGAGTPGGVAFFPANIVTAQPPTTLGC